MCQNAGQPELTPGLGIPMMSLLGIASKGGTANYSRQRKGRGKRGIGFAQEIWEVNGTSTLARVTSSRLPSRGLRGLLLSSANPFQNTTCQHPFGAASHVLCSLPKIPKLVVSWSFDGRPNDRHTRPCLAMPAVPARRSGSAADK